MFLCSWHLQLHRKSRRNSEKIPLSALLQGSIEFFENFVLNHACSLVKPYLERCCTFTTKVTKGTKKISFLFFSILCVLRVLRGSDFDWLALLGHGAV